jgi:hypothetical protein
VNPSITIAIALALNCAAVTYAQTAAPSQPATAEPRVPEGVNLKLISVDPEYGYSKEKPVKVGPFCGLTGPGAEVAYFNTLRDEAGKPVTFARIGSFGAGPDGDYLDGYEVRTSTNRKVVLYIDMYHPTSDPKKQLAPKGFFKVQ